jgi:hypothetical protein
MVTAWPFENGYIGLIEYFVLTLPLPVIVDGSLADLKYENWDV